MATVNGEGREEPLAQSVARVGTALADRGAWAVTAFATTSFMLGCYNAGEIGRASLPLVFPVAFFFGGLVQIIVACFEVGRGNVFGAVVFGTCGPFWVIFGAIETWFVPRVHPAAAANQGVALFLAMFAVVSFYFWIASFRTDAVLVVIILLIWIGLGLLAWGFATGNTNLIKAGGWVTVAFADIAWYHAAADMINFTFRRPVLPLFPINK
jgi:succinate-acetate transporter protein